MDANKRRAQEKIAEMKRKQLEKRIAAQRETIQRQEAEEEAIRTRQKAEQQARSVDRKRSSKNAAQRWNDRTASVRHRSRKTTSFSTQEFESLDIPSVVDENDALSGTRLSFKSNLFFFLLFLCQTKFSSGIFSHSCVGGNDISFV